MKAIRGPFTLWQTSPRFRRWVVALFATQVLYVLSFGPAIAVGTKYDLSLWLRICSAAYSPIAFVAEHSSTVADAIQWYFVFCLTHI